MLIQEFNGKEYRQYKGEKYLSRGNKRMHTEVWKYYNGEIPTGCEIHHKDMDSTNNDISNLVCLTSKEHKQIHRESMTEERREKLALNLKVNVRPKASEWHKSENGRNWHKEMAKKAWENREPTKYKCVNCNTGFETLNAYSEKSNKFCTNKCKSAYRRKMGYDDETRICKQCGEIFQTNKYSKAKTCSRSCANRYRKKVREN